MIETTTVDTVTPLTGHFALTLALIALASIGAIHLVTRIWHTLADALGARRRNERDQAIKDAATAMSGLVGELRSARHKADGTERGRDPRDTRTK